MLSNVNVGIITSIILGISMNQIAKDNVYIKNSILFLMKTKNV